MATFAFTLQGGSPTVIDATDKLKFAGAGGFAARIKVGEYNGTTHVATSADADKSSGNTPKNNKFISQAGGTGGDSQVDIGAGTVDLDSLADGDAALNVVFSDAASISVVDAVAYSYDGTTTTDPITGLDVRLAEVGDANFTEAEGSAAALSLADQTTPATSHNYYIVASVSPASVGAKTGKIRVELTFY